MTKLQNHFARAADRVQERKDKMTAYVCVCCASDHSLQLNYGAIPCTCYIPLPHMGIYHDKFTCEVLECDATRFDCNYIQFEISTASTYELKSLKNVFSAGIFSQYIRQLLVPILFM